MRTRILVPLGMVDTDFHVPDDEGRALRRLLRASPPSGTLAPAQLADFLEPPRAPSGGGGLVVTAADYLRFCEMLRRGGELGDVRLVGPKTLALMRTNHLPGGSDLADLVGLACSRRRSTRASASASASR